MTNLKEYSDDQLFKQLELIASEIEDREIAEAVLQMEDDGAFNKLCLFHCTKFLPSTDGLNIREVKSQFADNYLLSVLDLLDIRQSSET